jgi:hypothetical protein
MYEVKACLEQFQEVHGQADRLLKCARLCRTNFKRRDSKGRCGVHYLSARADVCITAVVTRRCSCRARARTRRTHNPAGLSLSRGPVEISRALLNSVPLAATQLEPHAASWHSRATMGDTSRPPGAITLGDLRLPIRSPTASLSACVRISLNWH